jgi:hypothetical protein
MKAEEWERLNNEYLKGTLTPRDKDILLDESMRCLNEIARVVRLSRQMKKIIFKEKDNGNQR